MVGGENHVLSYPHPTPRPFITASQLKSSSSLTGPSRSMPCSVADSVLVHVSSSLSKRRMALREEEEEEADDAAEGAFDRGMS